MYKKGGKSVNAARQAGYGSLARNGAVAQAGRVSQYGTPLPTAALTYGRPIMNTPVFGKQDRINLCTKDSSKIHRLYTRR